MELSLSGDKGIVIKDAKHNMITHTSFTMPVIDALWSGDQQSVLIMTCDDPEGNGIRSVIRYQWKDSKQDSIADNALLQWDADTAKGRYVICKQKSRELTYEMISQTSVRDPAAIIFLDAGDLKPVFSTGPNSGSYTLSPDKRSVGYIELSKDEYGDYFRHDLRVADISAGKVMTPAFGRRPLKYIWAGNRAIVYVEPDKYDLLSVRLFNMDSGKTKTFIPDLSVPAIKLVAYEEATGILYYKILDTYVSSVDDPVCWAISLDGKPISSEQKSFPMPKSKDVKKLVMPGNPPAPILPMPSKGAAE